MQGKKKWILTTTILVLFVGGLMLYRHYAQHSEAEEVPIVAPSKQRSALHVNGLVIAPQNLSDAITMVGTLLPDEEVDLSFETSGMITEINFQEGTRVSKGDQLARVNDKPLRAQLARYEAQIKLAENRVYRQATLLEKDAVSQEAYEQARTELAILQADMEIVRSNIALTKLRAPFDGVIGLRNVSEGAYASPTVVVAKLTKIQPLKLDLHVPERYADELRPGTRLSFTVEGRNTEFHASVYAKESAVDPETRTLTVRAIYPNANALLMPGRFASVRINMAEIEGAIAVPTEAIVPEMGIDKVYCYRNGKAHSVAVKTGLRTDAQIHIVEGLQVGDTIITSGTLQLREELPVVLDYVE